MNYIFKLLLTLSSTFFMIIVYCVKEESTVYDIPYFLFHIFLLIFGIVLSVFTIYIYLDI